MYRYHSKSEDGAQVYWRCHDQGNCNAWSISTSNYNSIEILRDGIEKYLHAPDAASVWVREMLAQLYMRAREHPNEGATNVVREQWQMRKIWRYW